MTPSNSPDSELVLSKALHAWREDVASLAPSPDLAANVLRLAAHRAQGAVLAREDERERVVRVARVYAAAAAALLVIGVGGALTVRHGVLQQRAPDRPPQSPSASSATQTSAIAELETHRMSLIGLDSVADLAVGGR